MSNKDVREVGGMVKKSLRIVSLLAMVILVAPSISGVASELVILEERDTTMDLQTQEIESLQELDGYLNALSLEHEESLRGSGSGSPNLGSNELEVQWDTINLDGDDYDVYTYWDHYPSPMPSPTAHYYLSPHNTHNDDLLRVAIYKGPQSEDNYVQDKSLQEEIITAMEVKGHRAHETERSDMIHNDHSDWAREKRDDWGLAALDFVDDLFFGADEEMNKRQIITLFLVKALDEKGCSPLSQESYYEAAEWYEDLITFGGNILPGDWVLVADLIDMAVSSYGPVNDYYEFIKGIADGEAHCDLALEALYETFKLLNDIQEVFDDSLEVGLDAIRAIIRGIWEIKIVEKYKNELSIVYDYLPDYPSIGGITFENPVKSTINDLINQPTSHLINNFRDAIITEIAIWGFDIAGELIATAAMKNPITAAIYIGVGIGLLLAKYLGDNWDKIRGHSHVALTLNTVEWSFRTAINNGNFDAAYNPGTYGLMHLVQNDSTAENLASFNFAQKIQLKAAADFYSELKNAMSGLNPDWKSESEKEKIKESMNHCQEYHDYREARANHSIPWVASSYEDIEALLALTRPVPNLHLDPSNIRVTYPSNPKIGQDFKIETLFENTGDVTIDTTIVSVLMRNKVSPYKWVNLKIGDEMAAAFGFDCGSFMEIISNMLGDNPYVQEIFGGSGGGGSGDNPCTIRVLRRDYKLLSSMTVNHDIEPGAQHYVNFNYLNVNEDDYAGYNNLIVSYRFITGGSEFWDSAVKPIKINRPPNEPRLLSPVNYSGGSPEFKFVADDPDGDSLQYTLRLKSADGSIDETHDLSASSYDSGEVVTFNYPGTLNDDDYFWWVRASDGVQWEVCDDDGFEVDTVAPVTYHDGDKNEYVPAWPNDWYMGNISLEASDIGSGVDHTNYSLDGGATWNQTFDTQTSPVVVIDSDGTYDLYYYSVDAAGVKEATHYHNNTKVDLTKPILNYSTDYDPSLGPNGWVNYSVSFTLAPEDAFVNGSASGVGRLHYLIERNGYYHSDYDDYTYSSPADFTLTDDGLYEIYYYAMDYAYNYNYTTFVVKIDKDPPNTTISNPDGSNEWHKGYPAIISVDEGSGVYQLFYHLVGDRYIEGNETTDDDDYTVSVDISDIVTADQGREIDVIVHLDNGFYNITYHAEDNIGRVEPNNTSAIMVDGSRPLTFYEISDEPNYYGWYNKVYPDLTIYLNSTDNGPSGFWYKDVCINSTLGDHLGFLDTCINDNRVNATYNIGWSEPMDWIARIYYKSIDNAGNVEKISYEPIRVDMTPPTTSYDILEGHSNDPEDSWVGVSLFSEDFAAGVFYVEYRVNGGTWNRFFNWDGQYSQKNTSFTLYLPDNQMYTIEYRAVDFAKNSEAMKTIYLLPDLRVLYGDIWIEGANLYVEVDNIGVVDAQDVPVYLYGVIHNPGGGVDEEYLLNSTILPEVRAKKSTVACFLPREYLGAYNIIKVVIDLDNATLPEIRKDNNVATKNILLLTYQWIVTGIQEIENTIVIVPEHICKPVIVEDGRITFKYSDLVFIEPCPFALTDLQRPVPPGVPGIQVNPDGVLELVDSTISAIDNIREIIVNVEPGGELLTKGASLIMDAIALIEDLEIPPPETVAPGQPPPIPSIREIIDRMRNAELAFDPAPPPEFIGEPSFSLNPSLDPRSWTVQPALQLDDMTVSVAEDSYLKLVNVDLMMTPSGAQGAVVMVHSGAKLYLIDSSIGGGFTGTGPACLAGECRLMGGGEIIQGGSEIRDQITYDVQLETSSASKYLYYGETAEYQIAVTNNGNTVDTFVLNAESYAQEPAQAGGLSLVDSNRFAGSPFGGSPQQSAWLSWLGTPQVTLNPAQTANVTLYVQAPPSAGQSNPMEDPDMFRGISVVTATSAGDNEKVSTVIVKTTIADEPSFLQGGNGTNMVYHSTVALGNWTSYDIQIENTDSYVKVLDLYAIDVPDGWAVSMDEVTVNVPEGETRTVTARVRAPFERCMRYELHSRVAKIVIIAESDDDEISATITITDLPHLNQSPKIHIEPFNRIVDIMESVAFFACRSTDPDGRIMSYRWDFVLGDAHVISVYGGIAEVSFAASGNYDVTLRVIDETGVVVTEGVILEVIDIPGDPVPHGGDSPVLGCGCEK